MPASPQWRWPRSDAVAQARGVPVLGIASITNQMIQRYGDFEQRVVEGAKATLSLLGVVARSCRLVGGLSAMRGSGAAAARS